MTVPFEFMRTMFVNGVGLAVWIVLLLVANMVIPLFFISTIEGESSPFLVETLHGS